MAIPGRLNGLMEEEDDNDEGEEWVDLSRPQELPPELVAIATAAESGDVEGLRAALGIDDVLETKLEKQYQLVTDKGALDSIGLHLDGPAKRVKFNLLRSKKNYAIILDSDMNLYMELYYMDTVPDFKHIYPMSTGTKTWNTTRLLFWESVSKLVAPGGILVITTCNTTKDELVQEAESFHLKPATTDGQDGKPVLPTFRYVDHIESYPSFSFGGLEGRRVATVALVRRLEA